LLLQFTLIVTRPFGNYRRGDVIENPLTIEQILGSEHARFVVRVAADLQSGL